MRPATANFVVALLSSASMGAHAAALAPQVRLADGALVGTQDSDVVSFKGVPFAAPPVGVLRWRPPQPVKPWLGARAADKYGPICQQNYDPEDNGVGPVPASEDCLTLNVFTPIGAKALPVMVWIHGGGFVNGSGTAALYDGSGLARQEVVVVTLNYRLGRFGFFAHPALTAEAKGQPVGNYGLMDMIAALKWVRANISHFGGAPSAVTIFGESSGGVAVNDLMASPRANGLFARAIVESGLGREVALSLPAAERVGVTFATQMGLPDATSTNLRALTPEQILKAGDPDPGAGGGSIVDGKILVMRPAEAFAQGLEAKVPYISGWNSLEIPVLVSNLDGLLHSLPETILPHRSPDVLRRLASAYPDQPTYTAHIASDLLFTEPALNLARLHSSHGQPTFVYQFSVVSPSERTHLMGAPHASERQYVFKTLARSPWPTDANDAVQANIMSAYWVAFAKTSNPNGAHRPHWPTFDASRNELLEFTNGGPEVIPTPRGPAMEAITKAHP